MDITGPLGSLDPHQKTTSLMRLYTLSLMLGGDGPHFLGKLFILFFQVWDLQANATFTFFFLWEEYPNVLGRLCSKVYSIIAFFNGFLKSVLFCVCVMLPRICPFWVNSGSHSFLFRDWQAKRSWPRCPPARSTFNLGLPHEGFFSRHCQTKTYFVFASCHNLKGLPLPSYLFILYIYIYMLNEMAFPWFRVGGLLFMGIPYISGLWSGDLLRILTHQPSEPTFGTVGSPQVNHKPIKTKHQI